MATFAGKLLDLLTGGQQPLDDRQREELAGLTRNAACAFPESKFPEWAIAQAQDNSS
jgi:hypothetical protein